VVALPGHGLAVAVEGAGDSEVADAADDHDGDYCEE